MYSLLKVHDILKDKEVVKAANTEMICGADSAQIFIDSGQKGLLVVTMVKATLVERIKWYAHRKILSQYLTAIVLRDVEIGRLDGYLDGWVSELFEAVPTFKLVVTSALNEKEKEILYHYLTAYHGMPVEIINHTPSISPIGGLQVIDDDTYAKFYKEEKDVVASDTGK